MKQIKQHALLIGAIAIPVITIIVIAVNIAIGTHPKSPQQDFVYATDMKQIICVNDYLNSTQETNSTVSKSDCDRLTFKIYHFDTNTSSALTSTQFYQMWPKNRALITKSSDGYTISTYCNKDLGMWWLFSSSPNVCLNSTEHQRTLNIDRENGSVVFITWLPRPRNG